MQVFSPFVSIPLFPSLPCPSQEDRDRDRDKDSTDMMATPIGQESGTLLVVVVIVTAVITRVCALLCATTYGKVRVHTLYKPPVTVELIL